MVCYGIFGCVTHLYCITTGNSDIAYARLFSMTDIPMHRYIPQVFILMGNHQ